MASYLPLSPVSFFFTDTATTEIYTLSLHDALPICWSPFLCQFGFTEWTGSLAAFPEWDGMIINGKPTHAFGVWQDEPATYAGIAEKTGLLGVYPQHQVRNNWVLAVQDFERRTNGGDLLATLEAGEL